MTTRRPLRPVIAAVCNYNMAKSLERLLPQLLDPVQGYAVVAVMDDVSRDNSRAVVQSFGSKVIWLPGTQNVGPSANRNKIVELCRARHWHDAIIHFIDADNELVSTHTANKIRALFTDPLLGLAGGLVIGPRGNQQQWNYGDEYTLKNIPQGMLQDIVWRWGKHMPRPAAAFRTRCSWLFGRLPNPFAPLPPVARDIFWAIEQSMVLPFSVLDAIGEFPPIRFNEAQVIGIELVRRGLYARSAPEIITRDHDLGDHGVRFKWGAQSVGYILRRYGLRRFLFGSKRATSRSAA